MKNPCKLNSFVLAFLGFLLASSGLVAQSIVQEYYVPMPEAQIRSSFLILASGTGSTMDSVVSMVVGTDGTKVVYDHWEDGYEVDLNNPSQSTTKIWGDGNNANGIAPGFANDPSGLAAGTVLALRNLVTLPRNPATVLYDGRDRVGATKGIVMSRSAWATNPGTVLADATEVAATIDWGTDFTMPIGENEIFPSPATASMFEVTSLFIQASRDGTVVSIDADASGSAETTVTLNQGEVYYASRSIMRGATVSATKPVQVHLLTGDIGANYESRWFAIPPDDQWTDSYYSPVGTASDGDDTYIFLHNRAGSGITVNYTTGVSSGSFAIGAHSTYRFLMPQSSGAHFQSAGGEPFFAIGTVGAEPTANNVHDWGFSLVPEGNLTTSAVVGWGPGSGDLSVNGSPVWVTTAGATRIYVDYNGDRLGSLTDPAGNKYDVHYDVSALSVTRLYDPDKDQTGMRVYTLDGTLLTAAWGQDPAVAGPGTPYLDVGTTVPAFPVPVIRKSSAIAIDTPPAGLSMGDTLTYTITMNNNSLVALGNLLVIDGLPVQLGYVAGTTTVNGLAVPDSGPPASTLFPLDEAGIIIPVLPRRQSVVITYSTTIIGSGEIINSVGTSYSGVEATNTVAVDGGGTPATIVFTDVSGTPVTSYAEGANLYVSVNEPDANLDADAQDTIDVIVRNTTNGDYEIITLTETGNNTGIFQNLSSPLASSVTAGLGPDDGTLNAEGADALTATWTDPRFGETVVANATVLVPSLTKQLYFTGAGGGLTDGLDRVDPVNVSPADTTTASSAVVQAAGSTPGSYTVTIPTSVTGDADGVSGSPWASDGVTPLVLNFDTTGHVPAGATITSTTAVASGTAISPSYRGEINLTLTVPNAATEFWDYGAAPLNQPASGGAYTAVSVTSTAGAGTSAVGNFALRYTEDYDDAGTDQNVTSISVTVNYSVTTPATVAAYTQTPAFAENFVLPAGAAPSATAYFTTVTGSMPASPAVTAVLKYGATTVATSSSCASDGTKLTFSFPPLGSNVTIPSGQALVAQITSAQSGVTFRIDYDSSTKPSRIDLPTNTVIHVDSIGIYDAPYPGGTLVTNGTNGQTLYVRTVAGDPFGAADITGAALTIDGDGTAGDLTVALGAGEVVDSDAATKTYEYAWSTGSTTGNYNVAVTAEEGYEGVITAEKATSVNLSFLDLGTPSITGFTSGLNGSPTPTYATDTDVCVRVTDVDQNLSATTIETVTAVVTASSGDSELITLTETGADTGVFVYCLPASSTVPGTADDGSLYAPAGTALTVSYTDPTDPSDISGSNASVPLPPGTPGITVVKTLLDPADGQATVGSPVSYRVRVTNTGTTSLGAIAVTDSYPAALLTYEDASEAPTTAGSGTITWSDVGALNPGESTSITVYFTAAGSGSAVNSVLADAGGGITDSDSASVLLTAPGVTVTKTLVSPSSGPVAKGGIAEFSITVQNTGDTEITTLPLEDLFSGAVFAYDSATPAPDSAGSGSLLWLDITGAGSLAPGASQTISVFMLVKGAANPAINSAEVNYAEDVNGDSVPPASDIASVVTTAASLSGTVYLEGGTPGFGGDSPFEGVRVNLYTDPNGDGDPSDGVLAGTTETLADGSYEFLNLATGTYVVVEEDVVGYMSVDDTQGSATDNRIPVTLTSTPSTGNDFLDDVASTYVSVSGSVINDANGNGINDAETGIGTVTVELYTDPNGDGDPSDGVLFATETTNGSGDFTFTNVPPGNYVVVETDPGGYVSTGDSDRPNDNRIGVAVAGANVTGLEFLDTNNTGNLGTIGNLIWHDSNNDGLYNNAETGIGGVIVELYRQGDDPEVGAFYTTVTDGSGAYSFPDVPNGTWFVYLPASNFAPGGALEAYPLASTSVDPLDNQQDSDNNGAQAGAGLALQSPDIAIAAGETENTIDMGLYNPKPGNYIDWALLNVVDPDDPGGDPDGDGNSNLLEFALCFDPTSGADGCPLEMSSGAFGLQACYRIRTDTANVTYTLEYIPDLNLSGPDGAGWVPVDGLLNTATTLSPGVELICQPSLDTLPGMSEGGFVRLKIESDANNDGDTADAGETVRTYAVGWTDRTLAQACETFSMPYLQCSALTATVAGYNAGAGSLDLTPSLGSHSLASLLTSGCYYIEVQTGPYAGHRFDVDVASTTATDLFINTNTGTDGFRTNTRALPDLTGARIAVRPYWTLEELFPPADFLAGASAAVSDYILVLEDGVWITYYVLDNLGTPQWVRAGAGLTDQGARCMNPGEGMFVHRRASSLAVQLAGHVLDVPFARPLSTGYDLVPNPWPADTVTLLRLISTLDGFTGGRAPATSDQILQWNGDLTPGGGGYRTHFLLSSGAYQYWTQAGQVSVPDLTLFPLFLSDRSLLFHLLNPQPDYVMPVPWVP